uniref:Uncharacterized protein n=1 Tax=Anguilla anguilla TaxID=7936 RepID=A0A0E9VCM2_ANGAN
MASIGVFTSLPSASNIFNVACPNCSYTAYNCTHL